MNNDNYAEKRELFNKLWRAKLHQYTNAEMNETQIQAAYERHQEEFNSDWRWIKHTQSLDGMLFDDGYEAGEDRSPLLDRYLERFSVCQPEISGFERYAWIEDLDTPELIDYVKSLSKKDLEMLTLMVVDGFSRADLSREMNVSRAAITKRTNRVKKEMENIIPEIVIKPYRKD